MRKILYDNSSANIPNENLKPIGMRKNKRDLTNQKFGRLKVLKLDKIVTRTYENRKSYSYYWLCKCECGKLTSVVEQSLTSGNTKSCGCLQKETATKLAPLTRKKYNTYEFIDDYVKGSREDGQYFYIDSEDYEKVKEYCWHPDHYGHWVAYNPTNRKFLRLNVLIMNFPTNMDVDHIDGKKYDNRKTNLRVCSHQQNSFNRKVPTNNTSGFIGVSWDKSKKSWTSSLKENDEIRLLKRYKNKEDAIKARLEAELKYFGKDFAPQRHLFDEYGIGGD